ncbi:uncharacterized protein N7483_003435 [Penicillium malachiteum]|uniref:uncharacterized protein n=1 Tax=Penicillium malachiteum TaxID=1324776 RepID=UPI00254945F1|nr:uncharacterized protein N7483_003435 [Penicillium malachiteum]KAJ5728927.1 hypothetical protein N7483_003435 [Penicillium malachiteum]
MAEEIEKVQQSHGESLDQDIVTGKMSKSGVVLRPQPTNDPNEPLNWPQREKYATYLVLCWFTFLAFTNSSAFTVAVESIVKEFDKTRTEASYLTSLQVLAMGFGAAFWMPIARKIGKRPVYLLSILFLCFTNIWSYYSRSYGNLLASRIVGGFLTAASDAPVSSVAADLFYFHERGHTLMIFNIAISSGAFFGPFINAYITQYLGWPWMCGVMAIASGATFIPAVLLVKETAYIVPFGVRDLDQSAETYAPKRSWVASMSLTAGINRDASFLKWVFETAQLFAYPPIWFSGLTVGLFIGCNIAIQLTSSQTFTAAPYSWQLHEVGLLSLSGFVGSLLSFFFGGWLIDWIATTKRHGEPVEPEHRLPAMIIPAVIGPMGLLTFGLVIATGKSWAGAAVGYGMQGFGATAAANIAVTYAVDAYRMIAGETIVIVFVLRNVIVSLISTYISKWFESQGLKKAYGELVGVAYIILSFTLIMYFVGHRLRRFTLAYGPMTKYTER